MLLAQLGGVKNRAKSLEEPATSALLTVAASTDATPPLVSATVLVKPMF
jgi:hypothetical protein